MIQFPRHIWIRIILHADESDMFSVRRVSQWMCRLIPGERVQIRILENRHHQIKCPACLPPEFPHDLLRSLYFECRSCRFTGALCRRDECLQPTRDPQVFTRPLIRITKSFVLKRHATHYYVLSPKQIRDVLPSHGRRPISPTTNIEKLWSEAFAHRRNRIEFVLYYKGYCTSCYKGYLSHN